MCYSAILPAAVVPSNSDSDLVQLTYVFNRWMKMLTSYGKLDEQSLNADFQLMSKIIKGKHYNKELKRTVRHCRDYALSEFSKINDLMRTASAALNILCKLLSSKEIKVIEKAYADQGMTEKYRPLSKRLAKEKIRKIGKEMRFTDKYTDDKCTTRLVRRIVEKRAAQTVHKHVSEGGRKTNRYRHMVKRATSFSLYNKRYAEYDAQLRAPGTHWRVVKQSSKGKIVLTAKHCYNTYEEALEACRIYLLKHPEDQRPLSAYKCDYCGKWHIGHIFTAPAETQEVS